MGDAGVLSSENSRDVRRVPAPYWLLSHAVDDPRVQEGSCEVCHVARGHSVSFGEAASATSHSQDNGVPRSGERKGR